MNPLRSKMIQDMQLRRFSPKTQEAYLSAVAGLAKYYHQSPDQLTQAQVHAYLLHLMNERKLSWSTCNQVASGLRFFYNETLDKKAIHLVIPPRKNAVRLPEVRECQRTGTALPRRHESERAGAVDDHICRRPACQ